VARKSLMLVKARRDDGFRLSPTMIFNIEVKGRVPTVRQLHSLAQIYGVDVHEAAEWYLKRPF
jgi:hypothetical protein